MSILCDGPNILSSLTLNRSVATWLQTRRQKLWSSRSYLGNKGILITVESSDGSGHDILGRLMVGKASLVWFKKYKKNKGHKVNWQEFIDWIEAKEETGATPP